MAVELPGVEMYLPAGHGVYVEQVAAPASEKEPLEQGEHEAEPAAAKVPAAHCPQTTFEVAVPGEVGALPAAHVAQGVHAEEPGFAEKKPLGHAVHEVLPAAANWPAAQALQTVLDVLVQTAEGALPAAQIAHAAQAAELVLEAK